MTRTLTRTAIAASVLLAVTFTAGLAVPRAQADPSLPEIHLALAQIYFDLKRLDEARREVELELKLVPGSQAALTLRQKIEQGQER